MTRKDEDQVKGINFHDIIMDYYCMHHVYFASGCDGNPFCSMPVVVTIFQNLLLERRFLLLLNILD